MEKSLSKVWSQDQINLITRTVAKGSTPDELALFLYTANRVGLDPLTKQIHFIKRRQWDKTTGGYVEVGTTQTGIDGYRAIAERTGELAGEDDAVFDDEAQIHPNKASVTVYRFVKGQRVSFTASARWVEYVQKHPKTGDVMGLWAKMPYGMLAKCAAALAYRKAFPFNLSGLYTNEEMTQADTTLIEQKPEQKDTSKKVDRARKIAEEIEDNTKIIKSTDFDEIDFNEKDEIEIEEDLV